MDIKYVDYIVNNKMNSLSLVAPMDYVLEMRRIREIVVKNEKI